MEAIKLRLPPTSSSSQFPSIPGFVFWSPACNSKAKVLSRPPQWKLRSVQSPWNLKRLIANECTSEKQQQAVVVNDEGEAYWGKVSAVLFDMDGVLCNSEEPSRMAAVSLFEEMGVSVTADDFVPFMGMGEAYFLGGVAQAKGVTNFDTDAAKKRFFEIYLDKYAKPNSGLGFPGALELINQCKNKGLKVAVASSADRIKVEANLAASGLPSSMFDCIVSADAFENLKPAPDIFLAASKLLDVPPNECLVIEDALAGVQAANAALMRCIAVTTTLSEEALRNAKPSLIRKNIGSISLEDVLFGGFSSLKKNLQESEDKFLQGFDADNKQVKDKELSAEQFQGSRRNILKYGSLGISLSCLYFAFSNRKAMQYASPKAIWNLFFGVPQPSLEKNTGLTESSRVKQFVKYIAELENGTMSTKVPEFPSKLDWLNTAPLRFNRDLKGKVVLLDFWTYCCINCMHVLPDLEFLEKKYENMPFTVVGVHSAKFDNEKDLNAIRNAVLRYKISHPVVNDSDMYMWRELGVNSWPTFALVAPNGNVIAQLAGEGRRQVLDDLIEAALVYYGGKNLLESTPIQLNLESNKDPRLLTSPLNFPGKLAVDRLNQRLFISDSNHNRIVVTDFNGNFLTQIGSTGEEGLRDGSFEDAAFNRPQGVAYNAKKNVLYVADTENHALREIDLANETVVTLSGNGTKGSDYEGGKTGASQVLNSPWDVCFDSVNDRVYIAMAGQHQIWVHNTLSGVTAAFSGDGYERNLNGPSGKTTSFAQPSGVSLSPDIKELYVADSESSSIRVVDLATAGSKLLVGGDPFLSDNLFKFGDSDGTGSEVLLQHPLGVVHASDNNIYIADSYNHKIKKIDPQTKRVTTVAGTGTAGFLDGTPLASQLSEPAGIVEAQNGTFIIADTNNSLLRILDLKSPFPVLRTLQLQGVRPPLPNTRAVTRLRRRPPAGALTRRIAPVSSIEGEIRIAISLPEDYHFSKEARSRFFVDVEPNVGVVLEPGDGFFTPRGTASVHFARSASVGSSVGRISSKVYYCKEDELCLYQSVVFEVPFEPTGGDTSSEVVVSYEVKPPDTSIKEIGLPVGN